MPLVPKEKRRNLAWRREVIERGISDEGFAAELYRLCSEDILFYVNGFLWTYDPRKVKAPVIPFLTWPEFQDGLLVKMVRSVEEGHGLIIEKSRDMGCSWLPLIAFEWLARFKPNLTFLCVSRKEDLVDCPGDPDSLFWKLDFIHERLPRFLAGSRVRTGCHISYPGTGSTIDGESTNGDLSRGGRRTAILLDEFAAVKNGYEVNSATSSATECRIKVSTHKGEGTAFAQDIRNGGMEVVTVHWSLHPEKKQGLYTVRRDGSVELLDKEYWTPERKEEYQFVRQPPDSARYKFRSPWYDAKVKEIGNRQEVAQELDIDSSGSASLFFEPQVIERYKEDWCREPYHVGDIDFTAESLAPSGWLEQEKGLWSLWTTMEKGGKPPADRQYVIAADISTGTGASNSTIAVGDLKTGEKVAEFATPHVREERFALLFYVAARFFNNAFAIWEAAGPGRTFGNRLTKDLGYRNVYMRTEESALVKNAASNFPGWWPSPEAKHALLTEYRRALSTGEFINRSEKAVGETLQYVYDGQTVEHCFALSIPDPSGARKNHGDRVIADALVWKGMQERGIRKVPKPKVVTEPPLHSFAWRRAVDKQERTKETVRSF